MLKMNKPLIVTRKDVTHYKASPHGDYDTARYHLFYIDEVLISDHGFKFACGHIGNEVLEEDIIFGCIKKGLFYYVEN